MRAICKCGKEFKAQPHRIKEGKDKYCSKGCGYKYRTRPKGLNYKKHKENPTSFKKGNISWNEGKGKGWIYEEYRYINVDGKKKREQRVIIENYTQRKLLPKEIVHHINQNKLDNRIENLKVMSLSNHLKLHHNLRRRKKCQEV